MSSHGEISVSGRDSSTSSNSSSAHSVWVHVVPHFGGVLMTMSSGRNRNPSHRAVGDERVVPDRRVAHTASQTSGVLPSPSTTSAGVRLSMWPMSPL